MPIRDNQLANGVKRGDDFVPCFDGVRKVISKNDFTFSNFGRNNLAGVGHEQHSPQNIMGCHTI